MLDDIYISYSIQYGSLERLNGGNFTPKSARKWAGNTTRQIYAILMKLGKFSKSLGN